MKCHFQIFYTRSIRETELAALHVLHTFHLFNLFVDKNADRDQNCSLDLIYFQRDWSCVYFSGGFISHLFGDYANINMWK